MKSNEDKSQQALFTWAAHFPQLRWMYAIPNGGMRNIKVAAKLKAQGLKSGVWDICLPCARGGFHGLYIEMKYGKNKLTENQVEFEKHLVKENYEHHVCYDWLDAKNIIKDYMGL